MHAGGEEVEEGTEEVKVLPCHVGHLEYRTDPRDGDREEIEMYVYPLAVQFIHIH